MKAHFSSGAMLFTFYLFIISTIAVYVRLDESAKSRGVLVYTGMSPINENPLNQPSDQDISNLARDAFIEMKEDFARRRNLLAGDPERLAPGGLGRRQPTVMAVLMNRDKSKLYFSSSLKASPDKTLALFNARAGQSNAKVVQELIKCQLSSPIPNLNEHTFKAGCGEIMAIHTFYLDTMGNGDAAGSRMVAVEKKKDSEDIIIKPFCVQADSTDAQATYGCSTFASNQGITGITVEPNGLTGEVASFIGYGSAVQIC